MAEDTYRLLGARDGLASGMLLLRREIGNRRAQLSSMPSHWTRRRAAVQEIIDILSRLDAELDHRRGECEEAWRARRAVEFASSDLAVAKQE